MLDRKNTSHKVIQNVLSQSSSKPIASVSLTNIKKRLEPEDYVACCPLDTRIFFHTLKNKIQHSTIVQSMRLTEDELAQLGCKDSHTGKIMDIPVKLFRDGTVYDLSHVMNFLHPSIDPRGYSFNFDDIEPCPEAVKEFEEGIKNILNSREIKASVAAIEEKYRPPGGPSMG